MIKPRKCVKSINYLHIADINCGGNENIDLKHIFNEMSLNLEEGKKNFSTFHLNNTAISELPENVFENITFNQIEVMDAYNLSRIHTHSFTATNNYSFTFRIHNTPIVNSVPNYDLFTAISLMPNLTDLEIINISITEILDNAFRPLSSIQYNLTYVHIENHKLKKLGNNAFEFWPSLIYLSLFNNTLNHISEKVFNFRKLNLNSMSRDLTLNLFNNNFNSSSFEIGSFSGFIKPTNLLLIGSNDKSNITYLDQTVFEPFLNDNLSPMGNSYNILNTLDCNDCRNYWLIQNKNYKYKSLGI
jgi:hypothetical protein